MGQLRLLLIITLAWFTFLFNIERIDVAGQQPFNIDTSIYVLAITASVALLAFPNLGARRTWLFRAMVFAAYVAMRLSLLTGEEPRSLYWWAVDLIVLLVTLMLMGRISQALLNFELAVQAFVLDVDGSRLMPRLNGEQQINHELYRSRRFERPVSIVYCAVPKMPDEQDARIVTDFIRWRITRTFKQRYWQVQMAHAIASLTYKSDCLVEYGNDVVVCLPETNADEAEAFARQLTVFAKEFAHLEPLVGVACFPQDGLVFEDLAQIAKNRVRDWNDTSGESKDRSGDVLVDIEQRLKIEREAAWVTKLAYQSPSARYIYRAIRRVLEVALVVALLPFIVPVIAGIALAIYVDDRGPVFYTQYRTGHRGRRFKIYKFRTMKVNAPTMPPQVVQGPNGKVQYLWPAKVKNDPRITRVGRFLRKSSLDELPQLINVLLGDMSFVGPRPTSWELNMYTLHQTERLTIQPGITGLWQVCARETQNFDERLLWDMKYIEKMSLTLDLQILWRTVSQMFQKKGA